MEAGRQPAPRVDPATSSSPHHQKRSSSHRLSFPRLCSMQLMYPAGSCSRSCNPSSPRVSGTPIGPHLPQYILQHNPRCYQLYTAVVPWDGPKSIVPPIDTQSGIIFLIF